MAYTTIDDPSAYFHTKLYTGTGSELSVTNDANAGDFKPDWIWIKQRNAATDHGMFDSTRGVTKNLKTNTNDAESTEVQSVKTFNTDGFTLGTSGDYNGSSDTHAAWQWIANGGTTSSDTNGAITSTVQANATAGFSIMKFTSAATTGSVTVGHGLGAVPHVIIMKDLVQTYGWDVHHIMAGSSDADGRLVLNTTEAYSNAANVQAFGDYGISGGVAPTSTVFTFHQDFYGSAGDDKIVYCFAPIQGYSKFGSYTANNSTDGPFVYLGFKPAWIMVKNTSTASDFPITDNKREAGNPFGEEMLFANGTDVETSYSGGGIDFVSNGFKMRSTGTNGVHNANNTSHKFVYMAFAESPFVSSEGVPTTAR